ncbi:MULTISPECIES: hypothetical protein [Bacillus]|uniref:Uncharacterized protein n=2 Tax=Bacillus thuringiensis TaxID=1428 RepID=A0A9X6Z5S3_BACTU|nr:hypothetical protein BTB_502p02360 [Bacillus thuringiensis Bt407]ERI01283.1 hypothetical protein BTCBT_002838 [Bacillus thuringiensis T01-328]MEC3093149.1 hypothetical protein [Bacillus cereus]PFB09167.1 hypothetical protein CN398_06075 [Bacillus thuringiensis]PQZ78106.1 hypothetical protein CQ064_09665 [Bacillus sp. MYb78]
MRNLKEGIIYKVLSAKKVDVYHYHGSWFEYTWKLKLMDENGEIIECKEDTWDDFKSLDGKNILKKKSCSVFGVATIESNK